LFLFFPEKMGSVTLIVSEEKKLLSGGKGLKLTPKKNPERSISHE